MTGSTAPAPLIVILLVMSKSPVAAASSSVPAIDKVYVPSGTVMVSSPGSALAAMIASRREQSALHVPSAVSSILVTTRGGSARAVGAGRTPASSAANRETLMKRIRELRFIELAPCGAHKT